MEKKIAIVTGGTGEVLAARNLSTISNRLLLFQEWQSQRNDAMAKKATKEEFEIDILYADIAQFNDCEMLISLIME